jgi:hypothetical protein
MTEGQILITYVGVSVIILLVWLGYIIEQEEDSCKESDSSIGFAIFFSFIWPLVVVGFPLILIGSGIYKIRNKPKDYCDYSCQHSHRCGYIRDLKANLRDTEWELRVTERNNAYDNFFS